MKKLFLICLILLIQFASHGATGDILSATIDSRGWDIFLKIEGCDTGGTYNLGWLDTMNANPNDCKIKLHVYRPGWDSLGSEIVLYDTVYVTKQVRDTGSLYLSNDETIDGSDVVVRIALSEGITLNDTGITIDIDTNFYNDGSSYNASATDLIVTNSSGMVSPRVISNWSEPGFSVVTGNFSVSMVGFHYSGRDYLPLRCVKIIANDEHSNTFSTIVDTPTVTGDLIDIGQLIVEYVTSINLSSFTEGDKITVNYIAYPFWGDTMSTRDGVNTTIPTPLYAPQYYKYFPSDSVKLAVVDSATGNDASGAVIAKADFDSLNPPSPYLTIAAAISGIRTALGKANVAGCEVVVKNGTYALYGGTITSGTVANYNLIIRNFPEHTPVLGSKSGSAEMPANSYVKFSGFTIHHSSGNMFNNETSVWLDNCTDNRQGGTTVYNNLSQYLTKCTLTKEITIPYSTTNMSANLIRQCILDNTTTYFSRILLHTFIGNENTNSLYPGEFVSYYNGVTAPISDNIIIAFNKLTSNDNFGHIYNERVSNVGIAIVQNVLEKTSITTPLLQLAADQAVDTLVADSVFAIIWNNSFLGERFNFAYNDYLLNNTIPPKYREWWSVKNNFFDRRSTVSDIDAHGGTPDGDRIGNWSVRYGVGQSGNITVSTPGFNNEFWGIKYLFPNLTFTTGGANGVYAGFVDNASYTGDASGFGDYHLAAGTSPLVGFSYDQVLPYDLDGKPRFMDSDTNGGAIGAYEYGEAGDTNITVIDSVYSKYIKRDSTLIWLVSDLPESSDVSVAKLNSVVLPITMWSSDTLKTTIPNWMPRGWYWPLIGYISEGDTIPYDTSSIRIRILVPEIIEDGAP